MITIFTGFRAEWSLIFQGIALVTMFWGNLAALIQTNIKRMMAYSAIAQAGYIVIGLAAWGELAQTAVLFYLFIYVFMNAAAFGLILLVRKGRRSARRSTICAAWPGDRPARRRPSWSCFCRYAGIPPTAGFIGKYFLFASAVERGMYLVVVAGALNSVISLFYYFMIGRAMFMEEAAATGEAAGAPPSANPAFRVGRDRHRRVRGHHPPVGALPLAPRRLRGLLRPRPVLIAGRLSFPQGWANVGFLVGIRICLHRRRAGEKRAAAAAS